MKAIIGGTEFEVTDKHTAEVACSWAHLPKESHITVAGLTIRWMDVCRLFNMRCPDLLVIRDQEEAPSEEGWEDISISQLERELAENAQLKEGINNLLQFKKRDGLFISERHYARLVFNNHTTKVEWWVAKKWTTNCCHLLNSITPETFVSSLTVSGFLRDSELSSFLKWVDEKIPELKGNEAHKKKNEWSIDHVHMFGGTYHTAWHVKISDNTPAGEYHRNIYLHETGSGKLSWNPSGFYDPYDLITVLRLKNTGDLEEWSPKDIFDMSNYVPATPEEAPEEEEEEAV